MHCCSVPTISTIYDFSTAKLNIYICFPTPKNTDIFGLLHTNVYICFPAPFLSNSLFPQYERTHRCATCGISTGRLPEGEIYNASGGGTLRDTRNFLTGDRPTIFPLLLF